jgi:hypothetical protein
LKDERVPEKEEFRFILNHSSARARVSKVLITHAGLRPESLGNSDGSDGLRIRDFPEMKIVEGKVTFLKIPLMVIIRPRLSKVRPQYFMSLSSTMLEQKR